MRAADIAIPCLMFLTLVGCAGGQSGAEPPREPGRCELDHLEPVADLATVPSGLDHSPSDVLAVIGSAWTGTARYSDGGTGPLTQRFDPMSATADVVRQRYVVLIPEAADPSSCKDYLRITLDASVEAEDRIHATTEVTVEDGGFGTFDSLYFRGAVPAADVTGTMLPPTAPGTYELTLVGHASATMLDGQAYWHDTTSAGGSGTTSQVIGADYSLSTL